MSGYMILMMRPLEMAMTLTWLRLREVSRNRIILILIKTWSLVNKARQALLD
jgi:hypothetical protein